MQKIIYVAITFVICNFLKIQNLWLGYISVFMLLSDLKFDRNILWEIPLALMLCDVLVIFFSDDIRMLVYVFSVTATTLISVFSPMKLLYLFPVIILAVISKNIYMASALWASVWYSAHLLIQYFTTKQFDLQEFKS